MDRKVFFIVRSPLPLNIRQFKGIDGFVSHTWSETATGIIVDEKNYCVESTLGFDVGVFHVDGYCYSSIYQEILNPNVNIFQQFYNQLNENLLFPDYYAARAFLQHHKAKEEEGFDVEWTKILRIYRINNPWSQLQEHDRRPFAE